MELKREQGLILTYRGRTVFHHRRSQPFVSIVIRDYKYRKNKYKKGAVKAKVPLTSFEVLDEQDKSAVVKFFSGESEFVVNIEEKEDKIVLSFGDNAEGVYEFCITASEDEGIFGGGEQFRKLNLKGEKIDNYVNEHIKVLPIVQKTIFKFLPYKLKTNSQIISYAPMTTFTSSKLYAVRFDTSSVGVADFSKGDISLFSYAFLPQSLTFFAGESYQEIGRALAKDIPNKQYLPHWCHDGMILGVQGGTERVFDKARKMLDSGAKISGVWCQDWSGQKVTAVGKQVYWNWEADDNRYPNLKEKIAKFKALGVHFLAYINPYLAVDSPMFNFFKEKGYLIKNKKGEIYTQRATTFYYGLIDLTHPGAYEYLKEIIIKKNMLELGVSGYMADFGESLPFDCVLHSGDPRRLHNQWPTLWAKVNREAIFETGKENEVFFFTRSGYNGAQEFAPIMWNGDQHTDYTPDYGMPCIMPATFNLGFSGLTAVHSDIGGFISFSSLYRDTELFVRWMEMNTFSPLMRSHETIRPDFNAQYDDADVIEHTVRLTNAHRVLKPYIKAVLEDAANGIPAIKPDFYLSGDFSDHKDTYSYLFGDDIFVAPIVTKGATKRQVFLPKGEWVRFFTQEEYGEGEHTLDAPLGIGVVFYRKTSLYKDIFAKI